MTDKDRKFIAYWENIKKKGRVNYAIVHGIIFGTLIFILCFIFSHFDANIANLFIGKQFFISLLLYLIGGIFYEGIFSWYFNTKKYQNLAQKK